MGGTEWKGRLANPHPAAQTLTVRLVCVFTYAANSVKNKANVLCILHSCLFSLGETINKQNRNKKAKLTNVKSTGEQHVTKTRMKSDQQLCSSKKLHSIVGKIRKITLCLNGTWVKVDKFNFPGMTPDAVLSPHFFSITFVQND